MEVKIASWWELKVKACDPGKQSVKGKELAAWLACPSSQARPYTRCGPGMPGVVCPYYGELSTCRPGSWVWQLGGRTTQNKTKNQVKKTTKKQKSPTPCLRGACILEGNQTNSAFSGVNGLRRTNTEDWRHFRNFTQGGRKASRRWRLSVGVMPQGGKLKPVLSPLGHGQACRRQEVGEEKSWGGLRMFSSPCWEGRLGAVESHGLGAGAGPALCPLQNPGAGCRQTEVTPVSCTATPKSQRGHPWGCQPSRGTGVWRGVQGRGSQQQGRDSTLKAPGGPISARFASQPLLMPPLHVRMCRNFKLLLWKNFTLKKRKPLVAVLEALTPLLFSAIAMYLRLHSVPRKWPPLNHPAVNISLLPAFFYFPTQAKYQLAYIPSQSDALRAVTEMVQDAFDVEFEVLGYSSVPVFENYIIQDPKGFYMWAGIVLDHSFRDSKQPLPLKIKYRLRLSSVHRSPLALKVAADHERLEGWCTGLRYPLNPSQVPRAFGHFDGGLPGYSKEGFLTLQHALDKAIMRHHAHNATAQMFQDLTVLVKQFPHGAHIQDTFLLVLQSEFPLLLTLSFLCLELIIINSVAREKEKRLKEYMCMMGASSRQHWAAWFLTFFISALIAVSLMTVLFCTQVNGVTVFRNSDPSLIFVFLLCFATATIFFAFMISTFFQKAHVAAAAGGISFFFTYLPYLYFTFSYPQRTHFQKLVFCLLSNVAMAQGVQLISTFEIKGTGMQWKTIGSVSGEFNFCQVLLLLLLDAVLYSVVAWYVEAVLLGEYGVPKPWYFFVMPSHWRGQSLLLTRSVLDIGDLSKPAESKFFQEEPTSLVKGIEIQHLYKVYDTGRDSHRAVKDLTLNLYQGQITVLLGHSGAGKTTLCCMLAGLIPPSGGWAYIKGYEISRDMAEIRRSLGWCPQHDILFPDLTVAEHLSFYAQLKGLSHRKCPEEVQRMLHMLGLEDKQDTLSRFLSRGMRRKLSIGIALIAGSKVLMLDEPTSGMDALSRRAIWDLLQQHKSDRTVLLTTHFMDEADLLGDRVAIMAKGELQCCGSSMFLKWKYGGGYYMTLVKKPHCNTEEICCLIYHHIPNAVLQSSKGEELTFILPKKDTHRFASLFTQLEARQEELGVANFQVAVTTMEEVFMRVKKLSDSNTDVQALKISSTQFQQRVSVSRIKRIQSRIFSMQPGLPVQLNTGARLICQQFYAMFLKRFTYSWRNWMLMVTMQVLAPLAITVFSLAFLSLDTRMDEVPLELTLKTYGRTTVPFYISPNSRLGPRLSEYFTNMLEAEEQLPLETLGSVEDLLLQKEEEEPEVFDYKYVVAASFEDSGNHTTVTALFNNHAYHSPAVALALVDNILFKLLSGARASITAVNHPQPRTALEASEDILYQGPKAHFLITNLLFGIAFLSSSFSILTVKERSTKAKHIQFTSGVYVATFWLSALLWDFITSFVPSLLLLVVFLYYKEEAFTHEGNIPAILLALALYSWASTPFVYLASFCLHYEGSAFIKLFITLTFLSICPNILVWVTSQKELGYVTLSDSLDRKFLLLPGHCLGMALFNLYYNYGIQKLCKARKLDQQECNQLSEGSTVQESIYAWEPLGMGKYLAAMAIMGFVYLVLLFLIETNVLWGLKARFPDFNRKGLLGTMQEAASMPVDQDVEQEAKMVETYLEKLRAENPLVLREVTKVYVQNVPLLAVNKISFTVGAGECFGLLGSNGAGKTSILKMLTGEEPITSGAAFVRGLSISSHLREVRSQIGYCPQFGTLLNHMTGRETLVLYARIRGVPERHIATCVEQILDDLLMHAHADKLVKTYSGSNKRKLSTAIALLGEPSVIFLDEPSTGMDPVARRLLWDTVARARKSGKAIVITSHSMEECEALCTRLAMMVQGQFKCLGSPQHLKSKFGSGYSLQAKVRGDGQQEALEEFKAFVTLTFPGSILEDERQGMVHYHLPGDDLSWAKVFDILEQAKTKFRLDDYCVNQVPLEDIFLSFTCSAYPTKEEHKQEQEEPADHSPTSPPPSPLPSQPLSPLPSQPPSPPPPLLFSQPPSEPPSQPLSPSPSQPPSPTSFPSPSQPPSPTSSPSPSQPPSPTSFPSPSQPPSPTSSPSPSQPPSPLP
ncbi:ATP-binding cassette sub-family A member 17-like isoform X2 [Mustela erminea]|uniref:ATP-binding cassette sub-family A member 17-like isoform X2 n=1 Tax=Mustela erminea TaxID=36723 RepID=UPI001386CD79|nr:ATP-binding cassette sub-family A member 17-like isoform X2 [Mustela erminea]